MVHYGFVQVSVQVIRWFCISELRDILEQQSIFQRWISEILTMAKSTDARGYVNNITGGLITHEPISGILEDQCE